MSMIFPGARVAATMVKVVRATTGAEAAVRVVGVMTTLGMLVIMVIGLAVVREAGLAVVKEVGVRARAVTMVGRAASAREVMTHPTIMVVVVRGMRPVRLPIEVRVTVVTPIVALAMAVVAAKGTTPTIKEEVIRMEVVLLDMRGQQPPVVVIIMVRVAMVVGKEEEVPVVIMATAKVAPMLREGPATMEGMGVVGEARVRVKEEEDEAGPVVVVGTQVLRIRVPLKVVEVALHRTVVGPGVAVVMGSIGVVVVREEEEEARVAMVTERQRMVAD